MKIKNFIGKEVNIKDSKKITIYGDGAHTVFLLENNPFLLKKVTYITSSAVKRKRIFGIEVLPFNSVKKEFFDFILISSYSYEKEIYTFLRINGIKKSKIKTLYLSKKQIDSIERFLWIEAVKRDIDNFYKKIIEIELKTNKPKNILIYSPVPWIQGNIERMISIRLRARGHIVDEYICGGKFPSCGMEHSAAPYRNCKACLNSAISWFEMWKLPYKLIKLSGEEIKKAKEIVSKMDFKNWKNWTYKGYPLGKRVYEQVYWYLSGDLREKNIVKKRVFRDSVSYILSLWKAKEIFKDKKYDILIVANGKTIESGPFIDYAKSIGVKIITWEEAFVFDWETPANEFIQSGVWEKIKNKDLSISKKKRIEKFLNKWRYSKITPFKYYSNPIEEKNKIIKDLELKKSTYKITYFTSIMKDSSVIGKDKAFESMFESIIYLIDLVKERKEYELIIRIHPAETVKSFPPHKIFIGKELLNYYKKLPANVKIVPAESQISSYSLMNISHLVVTYVGTIGMEAPYYGKKAVVLGEVHYKYKGFTIDVCKKNELEKIILKKKKGFSREFESILALKYLFFHFFMVRTNLKIWNKKRKNFIFQNLEFLLPGKTPLFDNIVDSIENHYAFIELNKKKRIKIKYYDR